MKFRRSRILVVFAKAKASKHPLERAEVGCLIYLKIPRGKHLKIADVLFGI